MDRTPLFHSQGKQTRSMDFYRNFWCPHYDLCLQRAAMEDLILDCTQCLHKDNIIDEFALLIRKSG